MFKPILLVRTSFFDFQKLFYLKNQITAINIDIRITLLLNNKIGLNTTSMLQGISLGPEGLRNTL